MRPSDHDGSGARCVGGHSSRADAALVADCNAGKCRGIGVPDWPGHPVSVVYLGQSITDPTQWREQLHALALSIYQAQRRAEAARAQGNEAGVTIELTNVANLREAFRDVADRMLAAMEQVDPTTLGAVDRIILASGTWVEQFRDALPGAVAALPNAVLEAAGEIAGTTVTKLLVPVLLGGALLLLFVRQAERSPTIRAGVRRAFA